MKSNLIGTNDTATMLEAINATPRPRTFLRDRLFGTQQVTFETQHVMLDFIKGKRALAPFVSRYIGGKLVETQAMTTKLYIPPMVAPRGIIRGDQAFGRAAGEVIGGSMSPDERMDQQKAEKLVLHDNLITRREEWMCAKLLGTGVIPIVGEGVKDEIDLGFTNTDTLSGTACWGSTASKPIEDLRGWKATCIKLSGITPDTMVLGEDAADAFLEDTRVQQMLDRQNMNIGKVDIQDLPNGAEYLGTIVGVDVFAYPEWYIDDTTGVETPMIAANAAILFPSVNRAVGSKMLYGAYYDVEDETTYVGARIPRTWTDKPSNQRFMEVVSFPVPQVADADSWLVATVVE
jgi:hypothetical protein